VPATPPRGLPPRIALPIVAVFAIAFITIMAYLLKAGFGSTGSVFGKAAPAGAAAVQGPATTNVQGGGPPAEVMLQLKTLRDRIATHPNDDVALTQLGDLYLAANKFEQAIPLYRQALKANPKNVAAQTGLDEAREALRQQ
jgi:cytochrome c-type biogenesis protein CcmH/NrfG